MQHFSDEMTTVLISTGVVILGIFGTLIIFFAKRLLNQLDDLVDTVKQFGDALNSMDASIRLETTMMKQELQELHEDTAKIGDMDMRLTKIELVGCPAIEAERRMMGRT